MDDDGLPGFGRKPDETDNFESITVFTPITESNKGHQMLLKMGWKAGSGLGKNEQGRKEPVNVEEKQEQLGLGRMSSELEMARNATAERRMQEAEMEVRLDPERVAELRARWKKAAEKKEAIQVELKEVQSVFYCEVCKKQYTKVSEFDNHLSSYDHHHTKRLKDLEKRERNRGKGDHRKRERKEMEKEMARLSRFAAQAKAKANGTGTGAEPAPLGAPGAPQSSIPAVPPPASAAVPLHQSSRHLGSTFGKAAATVYAPPPLPSAAAAASAASAASAAAVSGWSSESSMSTGARPSSFASSERTAVGSSGGWGGSTHNGGQTKPLPAAPAAPAAAITTSPSTNKPSTGFGNFGGFGVKKRAVAGGGSFHIPNMKGGSKTLLGFGSSIGSSSSGGSSGSGGKGSGVAFGSGSFGGFGKKKKAAAAAASAFADDSESDDDDDGGGGGNGSGGGTRLAPAAALKHNTVRGGLWRPGGVS